MDAFAEGAVDYFQKPSLDKITEERKTLIEKIILAKSANIQKLSRHIVRNRNLTSLDRDYIIAIGASTGGTEALRVVLQGLPDKIPPIFVVQHIPAFFSDALAQRLNNLCPFTVIEAVDNMVVDKNTVYIAPGDKQMTIVKNSAGALKIRINSSEKRNGQRPSVDVCFESLSLINHKKIIAAILTGMGNDGALGLKKLKDIGAMTIAQNKESCVVFGMPNEAIKLGGACFIEPIEKVSQKILELLESKK